jgi:hypothetical protein
MKIPIWIQPEKRQCPRYTVQIKSNVGLHKQLNESVFRMETNRRPLDLEGVSWIPLLQKSGQASAGKPRVFSQYPHSLSYQASTHGFKNISGPVMGYSMRTAEYRYTEWAAFPCGRFLDDPMKCTSSSDPRWDLVYVRAEKENVSNRHSRSHVIKLLIYQDRPWIATGPLEQDMHDERLT